MKNIGIYEIVYLLPLRIEGIPLLDKSNINTKGPI